MVKDTKWKTFFYNNARYADMINGIAGEGRQLISEENLSEADTYSKDMQSRDIVRKAAFGINFAIIGIENQETTDYSMPLRIMLYDAGDYKKQAWKIRRKVRRYSKSVDKAEHLSAGEYLYGFKRDSRLYPVVTFILYAGKSDWDGPRSLHEMLDFTGIPNEISCFVQDFKINLIEIRKLTDTSVFKTDIKQVFDFIRCSEDKQELIKLVESDSYYNNMEEDAYDLISHYTNTEELILAKEYCRREDKINMCTAIKELIADGRNEGKMEGKKEGIIGTISICRELNLPEDMIMQKIRSTFGLTLEEAELYFK